MEKNQAFIASSNSFNGRPDDNGRVSTFFSLLILAPDQHGRMSASTRYVNEEVYKQFNGSGIYQVDWSVFFDQKGQPQARLSSIRKVKGIDL